MTPAHTLLSERRQTQKATYSESTYVWNGQVPRDRRQVSGCQGLRKRGKWGACFMGLGLTEVTAAQLCMHQVNMIALFTLNAELYGIQIIS